MSKLARFTPEMHSRLHKLAGRLQAATGKSTSVEAAVRYLFDIESEWKKSRKERGSKSRKPERKTRETKPKSPQKPRHYPDPMRVFSFKHKKFI